MNQPKTTRWAETKFYRPLRRVKFRRPGKNFKPLQGEQLSFDFDAPLIKEGFFEALEATFPERGLTEAEKIAELNRIDANRITPANPITDDDIPF